MAAKDDVSLKTAATAMDDIYYFGIGPILNSQVRKRQRYDLTNIQAAVLPEHRLTFCYGGIANVVKQRGYEVHGVLMKFPPSSSSSGDDQWNRFVKTHTGYKPEVLEVFPYDSSTSNDNNEDEEDESKPSSMGIQAYVFVLREYDEQALETPIENIPSERYLKLIANGMRECHVDADFVLDSILSVPFEPSRKPEDYQTFLPASSPLPKITFSKYQRMCKKSNKTNNCYFIVGDRIIQVNKPFSPKNPGVAWMLEHGHGKGDITFMVHQLCVVPGLPVVDTEEEITQEHRMWAENEAIEFLKNCGVAASRAYELVEVEVEEKSTCKMFGRLRRRVQQPNSDSAKSG